MSTHAHDPECYALAPYIAQREAEALERAAHEMVRLKERCPNSYSGQTMLMAYDYAEKAIRALKQKKPGRCRAGGLTRTK